MWTPEQAEQFAEYLKSSAQKARVQQTTKPEPETKGVRSGNKQKPPIDPDFLHSFATSPIEGGLARECQVVTEYGEIADLLITPHGSYICESQLKECQEDCDRQNKRTTEAFRRGQAKARG